MSVVSADDGPHAGGARAGSGRRRRPAGGAPVQASRPPTASATADRVLPRRRLRRRRPGRVPTSSCATWPTPAATRWCCRRPTRWRPVKPFPAAVEDAHAVLLWAKKNKTKLGWTGKRMLVAGIEAGANLAAVCALMSRDRGAPKLAGQILIMPMLDPGLSTCSMREMPTCPDKAKAGRRMRRRLPRLPAERGRPQPPVCVAAAVEPLEEPAAGTDPVGRGRSAARRGRSLRRQADQPASGHDAAHAAGPQQEPNGRNECACKVPALEAKSPTSSPASSRAGSPASC
jgi:hypothetical protein